MIAPWNVKNFLQRQELLQELALTKERLSVAIRQGERLEHDLEMLRVDHARLVEQVGNFATRPRIGSVLDADPYKETDTAIEWLTPSEDEMVAPVKNGDE